MAIYVGVDIGGTTTTVAVGDHKRQVLHVSRQFATRSSEGPQVVVATIVQEILAAVDRAGVALGDLQAVGLATPGPATLDGVLLKTPNLDPTTWDRFPVRHALEESLRDQVRGLSVHYIGDGQAAALGEYAVRSRSLTWDHVPAEALQGREVASLFMVTIGTGLGGGGVRDGEPIRGSQGRAGHVGHITLPEHVFRYPHDRQLRVGNALCTSESAISLTALAHQLRHRLTLDQWKDHPLSAQPGSTLDKAKCLRELAARRDPLALELLDDQARALGVTLLNVNYLGDYDLLVIGGGVCDLDPQLRDRYRRHAEAAYHEHALDGFRKLEGMQFSVCGDDASVVGALAWVSSGPQPRQSVTGPTR